jgi:hypothetical protein
MGESFLKDNNFSRFAIVNVWRPICPVVEAWPLAICDSTTLSVESDLVSVPRFSKEGRRGKIQMATFSHSHRWHFFPRMTPNEVILLKTYDSSPKVNRFTIHTAFNLHPLEPIERYSDSASHPSAKSRESIETRAFVFYK